MMEPKNVAVVRAVLCSLLAFPNPYHCARTITKREDDSCPDLNSLKVNGTANIDESISARTNGDDGRKVNNDADVYRSTSLLSMPGLIVPDELTSCVRSPDDFIALLNSPTLLSNLSVPEMHAVITALTSSPGLLTALPASSVANVVAALSPGTLAHFSHPALYSLLTVFTVRPTLLGSLPTTLAEQFAGGLFSLSPGALYRVPTPILVNVLGAACTPHALAALSAPQLDNLLTLLSLSAPLVKVLPVTGFVSLLRSLAARPAALTRLPPATLSALLRALLATVADSSSYLLNDSTAPAVGGLLAAVLTPAILNVLPPDALGPLLAIVRQSPRLLSGLPAANVVALLSAFATSPHLLVSADAGHLEGMLSAVASDPALFDAVPAGLAVELMNALAAYRPTLVGSVPKPTLSRLLGARI